MAWNRSFEWVYALHDQVYLHTVSGLGNHFSVTSMLRLCRLGRYTIAACLVFLVGWGIALAEQGDPLVYDVQSDLKTLGYDVSVVDGLYGPATRAAIEAFQKDRDLAVTGEATEKLQRQLAHLIFSRSAEAERLWSQSRLYLKALGYSPGDGKMESIPAQQALNEFSQNYWVDTSQGFSRTLHDLIRRRVSQTPRAHVWLCDHFMVDGAYSLALRWCRQAASQGNMEATYYMGWMAYYGRGRARSYSDAFRYFVTAADAGDPRSQVYTGLMYRNGQGVERDIEAAMKWYRRATGDVPGKQGSPVQ